MAEKLVRLPQLQRFKTNADATYQGKLTAGSNITISGNIISAQTTVGGQTIYNATITSAGWSGTSNTVSIQGIAVGDDVEIVGINPTGLTDQQIVAAKDALELITYGTTATNAITFYALGAIPSVNIPVTIRKITNNGVVIEPYTAGANITISNGVISAKDTKYSAGSNIQISANNEISATNTTYTAGTNVTISPENVISATDTIYTLPVATDSVLGGVKQGSNVTIAADGTISAKDTTYSAGTNVHVCIYPAGFVPGGKGHEGCGLSCGSSGTADRRHGQ